MLLSRFTERRSSKFGARYEKTTPFGEDRNVNELDEKGAEKVAVIVGAFSRTKKKPCLHAKIIGKIP